MTRPLIGLSGQRFKGSAIADNLDVLNDSDIDVFYADYSRAVIAAGGMPVFVPLDVDPAELVDHLDGLLFTGGCDIDAGRYGANPVSDSESPDLLRDASEIALFHEAIRRSVPTLGVCRGLQLFNVAAGGTLHQHVPSHAFVDEPGHVDQHVVSIEPGSHLAALYGSERAVNSLHHQAADQIGTDLRVTATSADGGIEAIEHVDQPLIAVQWHPEMQTTSASDPIFTWLVEQASS